MHNREWEGWAGVYVKVSLSFVVIIYEPPCSFCKSSLVSITYYIAYQLSLPVSASVAIARLKRVPPGKQFHISFLQSGWGVRDQHYYLGYQGYITSAYCSAHLIWMKQEVAVIKDHFEKKESTEWLISIQVSSTECHLKCSEQFLSSLGWTCSDRVDLQCLNNDCWDCSGDSQQENMSETVFIFTEFPPHFETWRGQESDPILTTHE